jgi:hypothetical protein
MKLMALSIWLLFFSGCQISKNEISIDSLDSREKISNAIDINCVKYINGVSVFLTRNSSLGLISPVEIRENNLEIAYFIQPNANAKLSSIMFRLLSPENVKPIEISATNLIEFRNRVGENPVTIFSGVFPKTEKKKLYKIVFPLDNFPKKFLLQVPSITLNGDGYPSGPFIYKYFEEKGGYGLCSPT